MISTGELLSMQLETYNIKSYIHNPQICRFKKNRFLSSDLEEYQSDVLYIVKPSFNHENIASVLKNNNLNCLIFDFQYEKYSNIVSQSSNIFVITSFQSEELPTIYSYINACCEAVSILEQNLFLFFNASFNKQDNLESLLKISSMIIGRPLYLVDSSNKIVQFYSENVSTHKSEIESEFSISNIDSKNIIDNLDYALCKATPEHGYVATIIRNNQFPLYSLICTFDSPNIPVFAQPLLYLLAEIISGYLSLHPFQGKNVHPSLIRNFLYDLVSNKLDDKLLIEQHASDLNMQIGNYNYLLILFRNDNSPISKNELMSQYTQITQASKLPGCMYGNNIILLISCKSELSHVRNTNAGIYLNNLANQPLNTAFVSLSFTSFSEIYNVYLQCLTIIKTIHISQKGSILYYKNFLYQGSISQILYTNKKKNFSIPLAEKILQYDEHNATAYGITILQYLKHYMKIYEAAAALNLHKNTLTYRLKRAAELFNIDFSDHAMLNALQLSLEILLADFPDY